MANEDRSVEHVWLTMTNRDLMRGYPQPPQKDAQENSNGQLNPIRNSPI